ncbi:MAG: hypothetical protein GY760_06820 [Deltaproteobacteria bacterium]|nr:hypothetical protein [Deltaproteobacteria bacterium]
MKLFIITRWGNPYEEDGPDGKDTNFLIRALSIQDAGQIADQMLITMTNKVSGNRPVKGYAQFGTEIGVDKFSKKKGIVHGPWIESIIVDSTKKYPLWHRDDVEDDWKASEED